MKKIFPYDVLSDDITCVGCPKHLKLRLVIEKTLPLHCYQCHRGKEAKRGHYINRNPRRKRVVAGLPVKGGLS